MAAILLQRHHARHAFHILVSLVPTVDAFDMLGQQLVLGTASLELLRGVDDKHGIFAVRCLALAEDEDASGQT